MIVSKDTTPERDLYFLGALLIELLNESSGRIDFFEAYQALKSRVDISLNLFVLTVDWLYLLGVAQSKDGAIEKCF